MVKIEFIKSTLFVFLFYLFFNVITHFFILDAPPCGTHVWRQCNTLAMSKNFAQESMNILEPRVDRRDNTNGITGSHFPLYEWILAVFYKTLGDDDWIPRIYSLLLFVFSMMAVNRIVLILTKDLNLSFISGLLFLMMPLNYYDSVNAMPDTMAISFALWSLYLLIKFSKNQQFLDLILAAIFSICCGLIKFQFLIIPFASIVFLKWNSKTTISIISMASLTVIIVYSWYQHALKLMDLNNIREYGLWVKSISLKEKLLTIKQNILMDLPEMVIGWPLFLSIIWFVLKKQRPLKWTKNLFFLIIWILGFLVFYIVGIERFKNHAYYFTALTPVFVLFLVFLIKNHPKKNLIFLGVLILNTIWSINRIYTSKWQKEKWGIPKEFSDQTMRKALSEAIPKNEICIIGPDISGCVYFYFTKTKGYSFENIEDLSHINEFGDHKFQYILKSGVKYFVLDENRQDPDGLKELGNFKQFKKIGNFSFWLINSEQAYNKID